MAVRAGIDLGTNLSSISYYVADSERVDTVDLVETGNRQKTMPSVVYYPDSGPPVVGTAAWSESRFHPDQVLAGIKRALGSNETLEVNGRMLTPQQVSADLLKALVRDAETYLGDKVGDVVITIPGSIGDAAQRATEEAGRLAGLNVVELLPEPHAVALAYALDDPTAVMNRILLVYDLSGGTFHVTLIRTATINAPDGTVKPEIETLIKERDDLGGSDWTWALAELVRQKVLNQFDVDIDVDPVNELLLLENCESAKCELSVNSQVSVTVDLDQHQVTVTRVEFEDATSDLLMTTQDILEQVLHDAEKFDLTKNDIDILISGGASKMPMITSMIQNVMGKPPFMHRTPELLNSIGAAYWLHLQQPGISVYIPEVHIPQELHPMVRNFKATVLPGMVELDWILPKVRCEYVRITRQVEGGRKTRLNVIYEGKENLFRDGTVKPGTWYRYQATVFYDDGESSPQELRTVALGEAKGLKAVWQTNQVHLSWKKISPETTVTVLKRAGERPQFRGAEGEVIPLTRETKVLYSGPDESFVDSTELVEGEVYNYTIVTSFSRDVHSQGVSVQVSVPKPPPAPPGITAEYVQDRDHYTVVVSWQPVPGEQAVDYILVRTEGSVKPGSPADGLVLVKGIETSYLERSVKSGQTFTYAVFTQQGDLVSRTCAVTSPISILSEVSGLAAQSGDQTVEITWQLPEGIREVTIQRTLQEAGEVEAVPLRQTSPGYLRDEGLNNGQAYRYRISCSYNITGQVLQSPGVTITAIPEELPTPAHDLALVVEGLSIVVTWNSPERGNVVVVRTAHPTDFVLHQTLKAADVEHLAGERVHVEGNRSIDHAPDAQQPYYNIFSVAGDHAVYCGVRSGALISDPSDLRLSVSSDGVYLRWNWPQGCTTVRIVRTEGHPPSAVDDDRAVVVSFSRWEYSAAGEKYFDKIENQSGRFFYTVFAQTSSAAGLFFSPGNDPGCQVTVEWRPWMTLKYHLEPVTTGADKGKLHLSWSVIYPSPGFAGFNLVASQSGVPASMDDGVVLFRWSPGMDLIEGDYADLVDLSPIQNRRWSRFFLKMFCSHPTQSHYILIIHQDTMQSYLPDGTLSLRGGSADEKKAGITIYQPGVPEFVICPYCFEAFPPEEMYFTSYASGTPVRAKYSRLDRVFHRPIQPPKDSHGRLLTVKLCAHNQDHVLPYSAGMQTSLIIGLIGARASGKSHYIATLIDRLQNQVGADMQAGLVEVTEETGSRYRREFYEPIFRNQTVLPFTIGSPPPLIYDMTLDGGLWGETQNRAVTLAFYDTAGENLEEPATAHRMVQYLRRASGVIFLVDPLQSTAIRQALPGDIVPPELDSRASPNSITSIVLQLLEDSRVLDANASVSIPVAIVMNKCDVLVDAGMLPANRLWSTEQRHIGSYDMVAHDDMNGMMAEYFQRWNPDAYNNIRLRFKRQAFFGASATGCSPDPVSNRYPFISPWRVEDPLLWLLAELNVIPKRS